MDESNRTELVSEDRPVADPELVREEQKRGIMRRKNAVVRTARELRNQTQNLVVEDEGGAKAAWKALDQCLTDLDDFVASLAPGGE